jgi:uncharacterized protein (DUF58 family)
MHETREILKQVKKLEITTKKLVDGLMAGSYHSIFRGQGIEFSEIREYILGDDVRSIDWNVTARMNKPYVKEFIEERDLRVFFIFDISASGNFGNVISKKRKALELIATLMFSAMRNNDNVGLALFSDNVEMFVPARKGRRHVMKLLRDMISHKERSTNTDIKRSLEYISKILKKRSIIFIISDFISEDYLKPLRILRQRHDVIAINVNDLRESEIPDIGLIELEDEETGEQVLVDTSDKDFQKSYTDMVNKHYDNLDSIFNKLKIDLISLKTDEGYELPLKRFFKLREFKVVR